MKVTLESNNSKTQNFNSMRLTIIHPVVDYFRLSASISNKNATQRIGENFIILDQTLWLAKNTNATVLARVDAILANDWIRIQLHPNSGLNFGRKGTFSLQSS